MREVYQLGPVPIRLRHLSQRPYGWAGFKSLSVQVWFKYFVTTHGTGTPLPVPIQVWSTEFVIVLVNYHYLVKGPVFRIRTVFVSH